MSVKDVPVSVVQPIIIRFLVKDNVKSTEIYRKLLEQFGDKGLSKTQVYEWCSAFLKGREVVVNLPHARRNMTSITDENLSAVEKLILYDRRSSVRNMAEELGISVGGVETIIHDSLGYCEISARWVPKLLNFEQKFPRWEVCTRLLQRLEEEGENLLRRIFTTDEKSVHYYTPEHKRASMEWRKKDGGAPVKANVTASAGKVMCTVLWDMKGAIAVDFLTEQQTVNAQYYSSLLKNVVKPAYKSKRGGIPISVPRATEKSVDLLILGSVY
nr:unnamed protein product [Callosobruchus analis]